MFEEIEKYDKKLPDKKEIKKQVRELSKKYNLYQGVSIGIFVVGVIIGIILGNHYSTCSSYSQINQMCVEESFNIGIMLLTWIISFIIGLIVMQLGQIISLLMKINENMENKSKKK